MLYKDNLPEVPYGYCHCGCGEKTRIAERTRTAIGHVRGEPIKFVHGHAGKFAKPNRKVPEFVELRPPVIPGDGTALMPLPDGSFAIIDEADVDLVRGYNWQLSSSGNGRFYVRGRTSRTGSPIYLHLLITGGAGGLKIDHIDGNTLNNRRSNFRIATHAENSRNSKKSRRNKSGYKGVCEAGWTSGRWRANIRINGRQTSLGLYDTPEQAALAYDAKAREVFGEFAAVNFPEPGERQA